MRSVPTSEFKRQTGLPADKSLWLYEIISQNVKVHLTEFAAMIYFQTSVQVLLCSLTMKRFKIDQLNTFNWQS